jgi:hypothetical protein
LVERNQRCGIYILHFANGEYYAGQAVDVTRRYLGHRKNHDDIVRISFRSTPPEQLNDVEHWVITTLESRGYLLRNIALTNIVRGERDFDLLMSPEQQRRWREDLSYIDHAGPRLDDPNLRRNYERSLAKLRLLPNADLLIRVLRTYVQTSLPAYRRSEYSFWSVSCQPGSKEWGFVRVNVYQQEVCAITFEEFPRIIFQVAGTPLRTQGRWRYWQFRWQHRLWRMSNHAHRTGGPDQARIFCDASRVEGLLNDPLFLSAARELNLRLMRKGGSFNKGSHCFPLADRLVE